MSNKFDFNRYDDAMRVSNYNGFIDQDGYFYIVSPKNHENSEIEHNLWARAYVKEHGERFRRMDFSASGLFTLSQISSEVDVLVHIYGFVYYSHDDLYMEPIIKVPDPKYNNFIKSKYQEDMLFSLMLINEEDPFNNPIFLDDSTYTYIGLNERTSGRSKKYEKKK